jgi:protein tyrosine/serine phosphatase
MPRSVQFIFAGLIALLLVAVPYGYARYAYHNIRNFHVVRAGVLYRSGQMSVSGLARVVHDHGIKTVVSLRDAHVAGDDPPDLEEEKWCRKEELNYFRLPPQPWEAADGSVPNEVTVVKFLEIMKNQANYPVLIHCFAGKHRTGALVAVYRMEFEHWSNERALSELEMYGYDNLQENLDVLRYLQNYKPSWTPPEE